MRISLFDKLIEVRLSQRAEKMLATRSDVVLAEMELVFAYMVRKRVTFCELDNRESAEKAAIPASPGLAVHFVASMSRAACATVAGGSASPI